jgi:hypothetical protein
MLDMNNSVKNSATRSYLDSSRLQIPNSSYLSQVPPILVANIGGLNWSVDKEVVAMADDDDDAW